MLIDLVLLLVGGVCLYFGAEWMVRGAAGLARTFGVSPLVVGATVVAYGTSAPELTVGIAASLEGKGAIAIGNAVGSNVANIGLILGATALIAPPEVSSRLIRREIPVLIAATGLLMFLLRDAHVDRIEATVLTAGALAFTYWAFKFGSVGHEPPEDDAGPHPHGRARHVGLSALGLAVLVGGGKAFVLGASGVAVMLGMSERTVGLTIVAVGTSLPELAACLVAAFRGHSDLAVGNVVGSNIFNALLLVGVSALVGPLTTVTDGLVLDLSVLGAMTFACAVLLRTQRRLTRWEGGVLVALYAAYVGVLLFGS